MSLDQIRTVSEAADLPSRYPASIGNDQSVASLTVLIRSERFSINSEASLEVAIVNVDFLNCKNNSHRIWAAIQRSRHERSVLTKRRFEVIQHSPIARCMDHVCQRCSSVTENVGNNHHVVGFMVWTRISAS